MLCMALAFSCICTYGWPSGAGAFSLADFGGGIVTLAGETETSDGLTVEEEYHPSYADGFTASLYQGGFAEVDVSDGRRYFTVPEGAEAPSGLPEDMIVIRQPLSDIYLANSAGMCRFDSIGAVDVVAFSGVEEEDWEISSAKKAMQDGSMVYAGKYSAPDYELLLSGKCDFAVENLMILHKPEVMEKLTELGIPVFLDRASEEEEPLGKTEWVIPYGIFTGKIKEAKAAFEEQKKLAEDLKDLPATGKTAAWFYVNSQKQIVCPKSGEAVPRMLEYAGGSYVFDDLSDEDTGLISTVKLDMETFLTKAKDADFLIYDATINPISSVSDLTGLNPLFGQFKAVQEGNVYLSGTSMYQNSDKAGSMIRDFHSMLTGEGQMEYLRKLS